MARLHDPDHDVRRLHALDDELNKLRADIDAARNRGFDRRKGHDRRAHPRSTPDRRMVAKAR
jgi:hypothetical protein